MRVESRAEHPGGYVQPLETRQASPPATREPACKSADGAADDAAHPNRRFTFRASESGITDSTATWEPVTSRESADDAVTSRQPADDAVTSRQPADDADAAHPKRRRWRLTSSETLGLADVGLLGRDGHLGFGERQP
jgi:hypothetical protein